MTEFASKSGEQTRLIFMQVYFQQILFFRKNLKIASLDLEWTGPYMYKKRNNNNGLLFDVVV